MRWHDDTGNGRTLTRGRAVCPLRLCHEERGLNGGGGDGGGQRGAAASGATSSLSVLEILRFKTLAGALIRKPADTWLAPFLVPSIRCVSIGYWTSTYPTIRWRRHNYLGMLFVSHTTTHARPTRGAAHPSLWTKPINFPGVFNVRWVTKRQVIPCIEDGTRIPSNPWSPYRNTPELLGRHRRGAWRQSQSGRNCVKA